MSSLATFECYGKSWVAEQVYGESPRHQQIAAGALNNKTPYCRKHLLGPNRGSRDPFPEGLRNELININFDLSADFDLLVVQHNLAQDPLEELSQLQTFGREILLVEGIDVPDYAYLENISSNGVSGFYYENYLTASDREDLAIGRRALTTMLLDRHND